MIPRKPICRRSPYWLIGSVAIGFTLLRADYVSAQPVGQISESIVVQGERDDNEYAFETRHKLAADRIEEMRAISLDELVGRLPSTHVPVNSRGEAILVLRNGAERQVGVFYDGAAINIPWDNRLDLNLFPAGLVGELRSAAGPLAPHYGVNSFGIVSISSPDRIAGRVEAVGGNGGLRQVSFADVLDVGGQTAIGFGGSYAMQDGQVLPAKALLPYAQTDIGLRTNTDRELTSAFGRIVSVIGASKARLTALHVYASKGIAPESDRAMGARFWRYPSVEHTLVGVSLLSPLDSVSELRSMVWFQSFGQIIDSYPDVNYDLVDAREIDRDLTVGIRELFIHDRGPFRLVTSANFLESLHRQRDVDFVGGVAPELLPESQRYRQRSWSIGEEAEYRILGNLIAEVGVGYDQVDYIETGDKPPLGGIGGWTGRVGIIWRDSEGLELRAAIGRKVRTPTMRELFGQALNRFLINPELLPERVVTIEAGLNWQRSNFEFRLVPFYQNLAGTIDQIRVGNLRKRINLEGSRVVGVEGAATFSFAEDISVSGSVTWAAARRLGVSLGESNKLSERPDLLASFRFAYKSPANIKVAMNVDHSGRAWSTDGSGELVRLDTSTVIDLDLSYEIATPDLRLGLFLNATNLLDALAVPQAGLPAPGRQFRVGIRIGW